MSYATRIWNVSERELREEVHLLQQEHSYRQPLHMHAERYDRLMRKIAYWNISRFRMGAMGVIVQLFWGAVALVVAWQGRAALSLPVLIRISLVTVATFTTLYLVCAFIFLYHKKKLLTYE